MTAFLRMLVALTISGGALAGCVLALTPLLRRPALREALWLAASLRMLLPITPEWPFLMRLIPPGGSGISGPYETARRLAHFGAARVAAFLWFFGACAALFPHILEALRLRQALRRQNSPALPAQRETLDTLCAGQRVPSLLRSRAVKTPVSLGLLHPAIILPEHELAPDELAYLLRYELARIRRLDNLRHWLTLLSACVHWFNPAAWRINRAAAAARAEVREAAAQQPPHQTGLPAGRETFRRAVP